MADSVRDEPWSNDVMATFSRLSAHLNTRWARDGKSSSEAGSVVLSPATAELLTGCRSLARARRVLHELAVHVSLTVDEQGMNTSVTWPKYSVFQRLDAPSQGGLENDASPFPPSPPPPPQDAPSPAEGRTKKPSPSAPASAPKPAESGMELLPIRTLVVFPEGHPAWNSAKAAFEDYGKPIRSCGSARAKLAKARLKDHPDRGDVLAELVHGYIAFHDHHEPAFDPLRYLTPETVFGPSKTDKYLDAYDAKRASGARPPFRLEPRDPYAGHKTFAERDVENLKHNAVEVLERINVAREQIAEREASRRQLQTRVPNAPLPALAQRKLD